MHITAALNSAGYNRSPFNITRLVRLRAVELAAEGVASIELTAELRKQFSFMRTLWPGDVLEIDTENYTVRLNGQLITEGYDGTFFEILPRITSILYSASGTGHQLQVRLQYTEQHI